MEPLEMLKEILDTPAAVLAAKLNIPTLTAFALQVAAAEALCAAVFGPRPEKVPA